MTPPINIDGTQITGASIDGQDVSEITVDGAKVFPASAIPDSVVLQYQATTFSQGDGTWTDDNKIADQTITGNPQDGTLSDGTESIVWDGSNDFGAFTPPSRLEGSSLNAFTVEYAYQTNSTGDNRSMGLTNSGDGQIFFVENNTDASFNDDSGNAAVEFRDPSGNRLSFDFNASNLNDGNRHDVSIIINDASNADVDVIIDGTQKTVNLTNSQSLSNFGQWDRDWFFGGENNGSLNVPFNHELGAVRLHDEAISQQTISAYPF